MTDRIVVNRTGPSTRFILEADVIGLGLIRAYLRAENHGATNSVDGNSGWQAGSIDGYGEFHRHSGQPFLRSGVAGGGTWRWRDGPYDIYVGDPAWGVTLRHKLYYGNDDAVGLAIQPQAPTTPVFSLITATTFRVQFGGRGNGGSGITLWRLQIATSPGFEPWSIVATVSSSGTSDFSGMIPGQRYYARAQGENAVGAGWWSGTGAGETLSGKRIFYAGAWRNTIAYIWTAGGWKRVIPYVYHNGRWQIPR